jgi:hypothetical protein
LLFSPLIQGQASNERKVYSNTSVNTSATHAYENA